MNRWNWVMRRSVQGLRESGCSYVDIAKLYGVTPPRVREVDIQEVLRPSIRRTPTYLRERLRDTVAAIADPASWEKQT